MIFVHELTKRFRAAGKEILAVDHVSFRVSAGQVYGLLGPNAAGKTTTLRLILGLLRPNHGYAQVDGFLSTEAPHEVKRRIGFVSADAGLYQWLTARELLLFFADIYGLPPDQAQRSLERLDALLGLGPFVDQRCGTLSSGQKQRVSLARALIHDPPIMLLDEPTRGLDVITSQVVVQYIGHLRQSGKAVIVSTHHLDEAQRLCDRFGLLHHGRLLHEGTLDELRQKTGCRDLVDMFLAFDGKVPAADQVTV